MTTIPVQEVGIQHPTFHDVLFGRGGLANHHEGNRNFRSLVSHRQPEYLLAPKKKKADIAKSIVGDIQMNGGKFLKRHPSSNLWIPVTDAKANEKTRQALREGIDVREALARGVTSNEARHAVEIAKRKHIKIKEMVKTVKKRNIEDLKEPCMDLQWYKNLPIGEFFSLLKEFKEGRQNGCSSNSTNLCIIKKDLTVKSDIEKDYNNPNIVDISPLLASSSSQVTNHYVNSKNIIHGTRDTTVSYLDNCTHMFSPTPLVVVEQPLVKSPYLSHISPRKSSHLYSNGASDNTNTTKTSYPVNMMLPSTGVSLSIQCVQVAPVNTLSRPVSCVRNVSQTSTTVPLQPIYLLQPPRFIAKTNTITNRFIDNTPVSYSVPTKLRNMNIPSQPVGPPVPQQQIQPTVSSRISSLNAIVGVGNNTSYSAPNPYLGISMLSQGQPGKSMGVIGFGANYSLPSVKPIYFVQSSPEITKNHTNLNRSPLGNITSYHPTSMYLKVPSTRIPVLSSHTALNPSSVKNTKNMLSYPLSTHYVNIQVPVSLPVKSLFACQPSQARGNPMSQQQRVMGHVTPSYPINVNMFPRVPTERSVYPLKSSQDKENVDKNIQSAHTPASYLASMNLTIPLRKDAQVVYPVKISSQEERNPKLISSKVGTPSSYPVVTSMNVPPVRAVAQV